MKTRTTKRVLTLVLAIVLTFVLAVSAFATWSSYQGRNTNNGKITSGQPPITNSATATPVPLNYNNPDGSVYTGVDAASVIQGNYAFTLYNGGVTNGTNGGARMQATNVTTGATLWNIQLDADASNDNQLSTPYYDSTNNTIYAAVTHSTTLYDFISLSSDWTASGGASISNGTATFTAGNQSVSATIDLSAPVHTIYLPTNFTLSTDGQLDYTVTLTKGNDTYTLVDGSKVKDEDNPWGGTYDTYNDTEIPTGNGYTLTITVDSISSGNATISTVKLVRYDWRLYSVSYANTSSPVLSNVLASGEGQINTHINGIGNYLFFGGWGGTHSYYQYGPVIDANPVPSLISFTPATQEDFYYAGAAKISENNNNKVVFGSENGKVYVRPVGDTFATAAGNEIDLATVVSDCGHIRSSICVVGSTWYLTSQGEGSYGYLWRITDGATNNPTVTYLTLPDHTSSTPAVSSNNYIYVGYYHGYTAGGVYAVPANFTTSTPPISFYSGNPVQSSSLVYSSGSEDYVYFTTNCDDGAGYCYYWDTTDADTIEEIWEKVGTSTGYYAKAAVQGFSASDSGYLVYGDDGHHLYIIHD